ncbi:hypothetical protein L9F63_009179, partial [Diploptera punctata]
LTLLTIFNIRHWCRVYQLEFLRHCLYDNNVAFFDFIKFLVCCQETSRQAPVLPTLNTLTSLAGAEDHRVTAEGVNCTFIRDVSKLQQHMKSIKKSPNTETLESLFSGFFEFYSLFDFNSHAISIISGSAVTKPEHSPLYIANPLERGYNVSKNLSHDETERLRIEFRNAAWMLESAQLEHKEANQSDASWGLNALFESPNIAAKGRNIFYIPSRKVVPAKIVDVSEFFQEEPETKSLKNKQETVKPVKIPAGRRRR